MRTLTINSKTWHDIISHEEVRRISKKEKFDGGPADYEFLFKDPMVVCIRNVPGLRFVLNDDVVVDNGELKKQCAQHSLDYIISVIKEML